MNITYEVSTDLAYASPACLPPIAVMQGDGYCRTIAFVLKNGGKALAVAEDVRVCVGYERPDGTSGLYDTLPDGTAAWAVTGNTVTVAIAPQVMTEAGDVKLAVTLLSGETVLSTFPVRIHVEPLPGSDGSSEGYTNLFGLLPMVSQADNGSLLRVVEGKWVPVGRTLSGVWVLRDTITAPCAATPGLADAGLAASIQYGGNAAIHFLSGGIDFGGLDIDSDPDTGRAFLGYHTRDNGDYLIVYDSGAGGWQSAEYRIVDFGIADQEVPLRFYVWFTANAAKLGAETDADDGRSYFLRTRLQNGALVANANYGETLTLDSLAFSGKTYREIFVGGSIIQGGDFESGIPTIGGVAGTYSADAPVIQSDVCDSGSHALMLSAAENNAYITLPSYTYKAGRSYYVAFRAKIDSYTQGQLGLQCTANTYAQTDVTLGAWVTHSRQQTRSDDFTSKSYLGCMKVPGLDDLSPVLTAYIDNVVLLDLTAIFGDTVPDKGQMDVLYEQYIRILRGEVAQERSYMVSGGSLTQEYSDEACLNAFMQAANKLADNIGMTGSKFLTPSGLCVNGNNNVSTAADVMKLMLASYGNEKLAQILSRKTYTFRTGGENVRQITTASLYQTGTVPTLLGDAGFYFFGGKGGSLSGSTSGQESYGILNCAALCGYGDKIVAVASMGDHLYGEDGETKRSTGAMLRAILRKFSGSGDTSYVDDAISREIYPVSVCACEVPAGPFRAWARLDTDDLLASNTSFTSTPDAPHVPASVSKLLTGLVVAEYVQDLNGPVVIHASDDVGGSGQALYDGEIVTYWDLLHVMLLESNNQAATALARAAGHRMLSKGIAVT